MYSEKRRTYQREYQRKRRAEDPEYQRKVHQKFKETHPERYRAAVKRRLYRQRTDPEYREAVMRGSCKARGYIYELPKELCIDLITDNCFYCGAAPAPLNGIDRVDNKRGYEVDNVVTSCRRCNLAKHAHTRESFESWALKLAGHLTRFGRGDEDINLSIVLQKDRQ